MKKNVIILCLFLCSLHTFCKDNDVSGSRMYKGKWKPVVHSCGHIDSLICHYIETNKNLEMCKKTIDILSDEQKKKIELAIRYSGINITYIDKNITETETEHPKRLSFFIYDKYFDRLGQDELALELTVSTSYIGGIKYIYLLKKNSSGYSISYLLGKIDI